MTQMLPYEVHPSLLCIMCWLMQFAEEATKAGLKLKIKLPAQSAHNHTSRNDKLEADSRKRAPEDTSSDESDPREATSEKAVSTIAAKMHSCGHPPKHSHMNSAGRNEEPDNEQIVAHKK